MLLAIAAGGIFWLTRGDSGAPPTGGRRLVPGLVTSDVSEVVIRAERKDTSLPGAVRLSMDGSGGWLVQAGDGAPRRARSERVRALLEALREMIWVRELSSASKESRASHGLAEGQRVVVDLAIKGGAARRLELGAVVTQGGIAARVDGGWPPVEVDRQILDDVTTPPATWVEARLAPFDSSAAQSVRATFPKLPAASFFAARESGTWTIREPSLMRADPSLLARLLASLSGLEGGGSYGGESRPDPPVLVRYEIQVAGRQTPVVVEIGDARDGDLVPGRAGGDQEWTAVSVSGFELVTRPGSEFRSRRLLDVEAADIQDIEVTPGPLHFVRSAGGLLHFKPPPEWGWKLLKGDRTLALDPSAQADWLQALSEIEAIDFTPGTAFQAKTTLSVRSGATGAPRESRLRFADADATTSSFARGDEKAEGHVRSSSIAFLSKPFWTLLQRTAYKGAWFSFTRIEVEEVGKRKVVIDAVATGGTDPDFTLVEPKPATRRRVPREIANPVLDKLTMLTVDSFVGHGDPKAWGLDKPQFVVRWIDSGMSQGAPPDLKEGQTVTWRIAARGPDGLRAGDLDSQPGLIMKTDNRDLDPFLNLLEWAGR